AIDPRAFDPFEIPADELKTNPPGLVDRLRMALILNGIDIGGWPGGMTSAAHDADDLDRTVAGVRGALRLLKDESDF
ncbi:MAG TPA: hypothetical protein VFJ13_03550, partial [Paracoccaceae bacterium]|nr:hypothetical protein [Paracoccaceae bacterium]